jgi:hypothetical protein
MWKSKLIEFGSWNAENKKGNGEFKGIDEQQNYERDRQLKLIN